MDLTVDTSTLPVDFEGSLDPSRLPEITLGSHSLMAASEQMTPLVSKSCSDRLSPVRGRTMKEYDQQISDLKKENFSLKMRIYYMEERMQQRFGDGQDVFRTNIELQVDIENLKRELADKQLLVQKAALAMETLTGKHEQERELMRGRLQGDCKEEMNQLRYQLELANQKCQTSYKDVEKAERRLEMLKLQLNDVHTELAESRRINQELSTKVNHTEFEVQTLSGQLTIADQAKSKCEKEKLALTQKLKDLEEQLYTAHKGCSRRDRDLLNLSALLQDQSHVDCMSILEPIHFQDELEDHKAAISKKDGQITDLEEKLNTKDGIIGDLETAVKYLEKKYKDTEENLAQLEKEAERKDTQLGRYKKSIESLVKSLHAKDEQGKELKKELEQTGGELSRLQGALKEAELHKAQALDSVGSQLVEAHANCDRLQHQLTEANQTCENLVKSLGKKEGELTGFQEQLAKAMDALTTSEEAVETLQAQLKAERADFDNRLREQAVHFQISVNKSEHGNELEGLRQQIVDLQKLIASQNVELLGLTRDRDVVADMQDRLKEKDAEIELLSKEHKREQSELERELQALRVALTGKDMQIETLEKHTFWLKEHQRETVDRMRETWSSLGGVNVQELSHNLLQDIKMLMDLLRQEITSLATLQLQLRQLDHTGHGISTEALSIEISSVQRIYRQLEEGVDKNSRLHQALLNSARGDLRQSDSPDNNSCQDGGYNLGSSRHKGKHASLSASPQRTATQSLSPQHKSAKRGTAAVLSESMSSLESDWGSPPASHSVAVETCPELMDRSLQTGTSFCHTDQWVQTSPMIGTAGLSPADRGLPATGKQVLSVSVGLSPICKSRLVFFDSDDDLRRHYVFGHHNDSLTDDAKEEHLGLYAENLEDYQNFQHGVFCDERHVDSDRYDQGCASKPGSQQMHSSSRRSVSPAAPTTGRSGRGGSVVARSLDKTGNHSSKHSSDNICGHDGNNSDLDEPDGSFDTSNVKSGFEAASGVSDKLSCTAENCQSQMKGTQRKGPSSGGRMSRDNSNLSHTTQDGGSDDNMLPKSAKAAVLSVISVGKSTKGKEDMKGKTNSIEKHEENIGQEPDNEGEFEEKEKLECSGRVGESTETTVRVRSRRNSWAEELEKYRVQNSKKDDQNGNSEQISSSNGRNSYNSASNPGTVDSIERARSHFPSASSQSDNNSYYSVPTDIVATMLQSPDSTTRHVEESMTPASSTVPSQSLVSNTRHVEESLACTSSTVPSQNQTNLLSFPVEVSRVDASTSAMGTNTSSSLSMNLKVYPQASPDLLQGSVSPGTADESPPGYSNLTQAHRFPWQAHSKQLTDASLLDQSGFPDVTYSSMLDNTMVHRLLTNLDHNMSALRQDSCNISSLNMEQLQLRVEHLERVNLTLREEIEVYEALHHSQGTQVSPSLGEEFTGQGYTHERQLTEEDLLKQHLIEIRKLRQRLERLDITKDPDQLLIFQSHTQQRIARQETMISHLQQQMVEKEEQWQRDLAEMQHRMCREKTLLVEKLEGNVSDLQKMVKSQMMKIEEQDRQIVDLLAELNGKEEFERKKEDEIKKILNEKSELEVDLLKRDQEFLDIEKKLFRLEMAKENSESECRRLYCEIEERDQDNDKMRKQIEEGRESCRCLKESVVKCEKSLQEKVFSLQKLTTDKTACDLRLAEKDGQIQKLEAELGDLRKRVDEMKVVAEEKAGLRFKIDRLREELKEKESLEAKYKFQKVGYETEMKRVTEENNQMRTQLESKSQMRIQLESKIEEAVELRHRIDDLQEKLQEKEVMEDQMRSLKEKIRSLEDSIDRLNSELDTRTVVEAELRERLNTLCHAQSEVIVLKEKLVSAGDSLKLVEAAKMKVTEDLKEREEKVKKRDKQLHHLLGQYKKMDIAFTKQKYLLSEKLELVQSLKKQMHLYEVSLTCASQEDKDNIMKQLLKELIATQRQVDELLSRLEQNSAVPKVTSVFVDGFSMSSSSSTTTTTTTTAGGSLHDLPDMATAVPARADTPVPDDLNLSGGDLRQELRPYSALTQLSTNHMSPQRSVLCTQTSANCSPRPLKYFAGSDCAIPGTGSIPQAMVGSDIRSLFAILKLDSHEKLRKETAECLVVLSGLEARLGNRLKLYKTKSVSESLDYSTLREASMSCQNLRVCLEEAKRLVATAWISELPPIDARGHFYDPVLVEQNEHLKRQLSRLGTRCDVLDHSMTDQHGRSLHTNTESSSTWQNSLYKQLHKTSMDLEQAKENIDTSVELIDTSVELTSPAKNQTFSHYSPQKPARRRAVVSKEFDGDV